MLGYVSMLVAEAALVNVKDCQGCHRPSQLLWGIVPLHQNLSSEYMKKS